MREGRGQVGRHDSRYQERQTFETECVQDQNRPQRIGALPRAQSRPDVTLRNDAPSDQAESDAEEKTHLWGHDLLLGVWTPCSRRQICDSVANRGSEGTG